MMRVGGGGGGGSEDTQKPIWLKTTDRQEALLPVAIDDGVPSASASVAKVFAKAAVVSE